MYAYSYIPVDQEAYICTYYMQYIQCIYHSQISHHSTGGYVFCAIHTPSHFGLHRLVLGHSHAYTSHAYTHTHVHVCTAQNKRKKHNAHSERITVFYQHTSAYTPVKNTAL